MERDSSTRLTILAPFLVAVLFAACRDSPAAPATGSLAVTIEGLPDGAGPIITLTGPGQESHVLHASGTLTGLAAGSWTVSVTEVVAGGVRYAGAPPTQTVLIRADVHSARIVTYTVASSRLTLNVIGLPAGSEASVSVTGPGGFSRVLTGTTGLELLEPGEYSIVATEVQAQDRTYRPSPSSQWVTLTPSLAGASATVAYGPGHGSLDVAITGLPSAVAASVRVTGPDGFDRTLASSTTLHHLDPGAYTFAASVVGSSLTTHTPSPTTQTIHLTEETPGAVAVHYASAPLQLGLVPLAEGLDLPVFLTAPAGDARKFIVERRGRIRIVEDGTLLPLPFLDIASKVSSDGERGMFSMAFDPQFSTNGRFYVYYVDIAGDLVVERYGTIPGANVAGPADAVVITIPHRGSTHHGGQIAFGPDGMLYIAPGDGGCCGDPENLAQNLSSLLGKLLRIDVRTLPYTIPAGNPALGPGARREIWAYGLRNPWRFSFDPPSGALYIADVGENAREEVNVVPATAAGLNFGWRLMEGTACFNPGSNCNPGGLTLPLHEYTHADGCSITGGYVYRGSAIPELTGHYLYADFCRGWMRSFRATPGGAADQRAWPDAGSTRPVSFGRDGAGELYVIGNGRVSLLVRQ